MSSVCRFARSVTSFAGVVLLSAVAGVLQVIVLVRVLGAHAWGGVAFAQSAAALAAAVVALGYTTIGPSLVAILDDDGRGPLFARSLVVRGYAFVVALPVLVLGVAAWTPTQASATAALAGATLVPVLGASWYFVGRRDPKSLLLRDVLPQVMGVLSGLALCSSFGLPGFVLAVAVGNGMAVILGMLGVRRDAVLHFDRSDVTWRAVASTFREQKDGLVASWSGSANSYLPMLFVARWLAPGLPAFALADRLLRYSLAAFGPIVQYLQGWLPGTRDRLPDRARAAVRAAAIGGLLVGTVVLFLGGDLAHLLSGGRVRLDVRLLLPFALVIGTLIVGQVTALVVLVPLQMSRTLARSTVAGTVTFLVLVAPLALVGNEAGVAWAMASCEGVAVSWQVIAVLSRRANATAEAA